MTVWLQRASLSALLLLCLCSAVQAAPISLNTALPVATDEFIFREQFVYRKATDDPSSANRELQVVGANSVLGYGINRKLAVFGVLPVLDKQVDATGPEAQRITRETNGIGDARVFGRYTVYQNDAPGRTARIAPFFGVKLPTGSNDDRDSLGPLPAPLQLGSGSWDFFTGIVMTTQTLDYQIDGQISYKANSEANNFQFGDVSRLDVSLQYRLLPQELGDGIQGFLYGVLEGNLIYQGKNESGGIKDPNSGGTAFFLSPGVQYVTKRWIVEAAVQLPVTQNLNGSALQDDFILRAGFRRNF